MLHVYTMVVSYILSQQAHIAILVGLKPWGGKKRNSHELYPSEIYYEMVSGNN